MTMPGGRKQLLLWIAAALAATAALAIILIRERRPDARHSLYIVGDPQRGSTLFYGAKQCSICHSVNGTGGHIAPDLAATRPGMPAMGWLATAMWNHAPGMFRRIRGSQSYPQLDSQEMADILAFLFRAANSDRPGDIVAGADIFQRKGCVQCHSVRSSGGHSAPELSAIAAGGATEWMSAMWNHAQSMIGPVTTVLGQWPEFSGNDMNNLLVYVSGGVGVEAKNEMAGDAERGWTVFQKRCIQCHSVRGNGGKVGPELGPEHELPLSATQFASVLWNHAPAMVRLARENGAAPVLEKTEMADVVAFVASLRYVEPTGSRFVGERVFNVRGCARCHGASAEGTQLGPEIQAHGDAYTAVSLTTALWKHGPKMVDRAEELGIAWPTLEANDLGDLVSFLNRTEK
ncbi:MAG: cytochrome c [Acidobacteriia bacterium]|nr:cytochrome c [Terriglobia bacterium]